ncbi:MAG: helix-turn-helix domain-containing protein [Stackebrandtia sp.]
MAKDQKLSLRVQWLGERLRSARKQAGYRLEDAAEYLQMSSNTMSRFERGTMRVRRSYIRDLVDFYGISNPRERDALFQLSQDAWRRDWWEGDTSDLDMEFLDYTWLEARAARICVFAPMLIPGLLQTERYIEAIMAYGPGREAEEKHIARMVELRRTRQRILERDEPTQLAVVMEEGPLLRQTGGPQVMRDQLQYLLKARANAHIDIRVLPRDVGWHPGVSGPFTFFDMPDPYPDVAFVENLVGRTFLEAPDKVEPFTRAYDELYRLARNASESTKFLQQLLKDIE